MTRIYNRNKIIPPPPPPKREKIKEYRSNHMLISPVARVPRSDLRLAAAETAINRNYQAAVSYACEIANVLFSRQI